MSHNKSKNMGIKTTHDITREVAIQCILSNIYKADNSVLAEILEAFPQSHFRNYSVQDNIEEPCIRSVSDFDRDFFDDIE